MFIPKLRNALFSSKRSVIPLNSVVSQFFASFHKANDKITYTVKGRHDKEPSKKQARLTIRQRRADSKRALDNFLLKSSSVQPYLEGDPCLDWRVAIEEGFDDFVKKRKVRRRDPKRQQKRIKPRRNRERFNVDYDDLPERKLAAKYKSIFGEVEPEWTEPPLDLNLNRNRSKNWGSSSESESELESESDNTVYVDGSIADRMILGLPVNGRLKLEDVKHAFRVLAMKWHPDRHKGPSQAKAEAKFKLCVEAYNTITSLA